MTMNLILKLFVFPLASFGFFYFIFSLSPSENAIWAAIIAGCFTWLALNKWFTTFRIKSELDLLSQVKMEDGTRVVVSGTVQAKSTPLVSPCTGTKCIAYRYMATHIGAPSAHTDKPVPNVTDYQGYAMTPSEIKGGQKTVSILAEPDNIELLILKPGVDALTGKIVKGDEARDRVNDYLQGVDFGEEFNDKLNGGMDAKKKEIYVEPGNFRIDICDRNAGLLSEKNTLHETVIAEGENFLISGIYNADKNGIGPGANSTLEPLRLVKGGEAAYKAEVAGKNKTAMFGLGLAFLTSAIYFGLVV